MLENMSIILVASLEWRTIVLSVIYLNDFVMKLQIELIFFFEKQTMNANEDSNKGRKRLKNCDSFFAHHYGNSTESVREL